MYTHLLLDELQLCTKNNNVGVLETSNKTLFPTLLFLRCKTWHKQLVTLLESPT